MNEDAILLFINVLANGDIENFLAGPRVIPNQQYDYFFYKEAGTIVIDEIQQYYAVIDGALFRKEV